VAFAARAISVEPGGSLPYDADDWRDTVVVVERGVIAVDCAAGITWHFRRGDLLSLDGMPIVAIRNAGEEPALLLATARTEGVR
jgi:hypothetical protein